MITEAVGLACDKCWHCGDKRARSIIVEKDNGWVLHSGLPKTASLDAHIEALLSKLDPFKESIRFISLADTVELSIVIYAPSPPALNFDSSIINQLTELGASMDIDLYILGE